MSVRAKIDECDDERLFAVFEAHQARHSAFRYLCTATKIDLWFLYKLQNLVDYGAAASKTSPSDAGGCIDRPSTWAIPTMRWSAYPGRRMPVQKARPAYKMVDTCAAEFAAETPYFYA